jgi:hypothetical protein
LLAEGTKLAVEDEGEGWFPLAPAHGLRGVVICAIASTAAEDPSYLLRLDSPLDVQEQARHTPSGLALHTYTHLVVRSRWAGVALGSAARVSVQVRLVPEDGPLPSSAGQCESLAGRIWASCWVAS